MVLGVTAQKSQFRQSIQELRKLQASDFIDLKHSKTFSERIDSAKAKKPRTLLESDRACQRRIFAKTSTSTRATIYQPTQPNKYKRRLDQLSLPSKNDGFICTEFPECTAVFSYFEDFFSHNVEIVAAMPTDRQCWLCGAKLGGREQRGHYQKHLQLHFPPQIPYGTGTCDETFHTLDDRASHWKRSRKCDPQKKRSKQSSDKPSKARTQESQVKCEECGETFPSDHALEVCNRIGPRQRSEANSTTATATRE